MQDLMTANQHRACYRVSDLVKIRLPRRLGGATRTGEEGTAGRERSGCSW